MKRIVALVLVAVMAIVLLTACSSSPEGKYVLKSVNGVELDKYLEDQLKDSEMSKEDFLKFLGINSIEEMITIELKKDGVCVMSLSGASEEGTWKQEKDKIVITDKSGTATELTLNGKELTFKKGEETMVLIRK